MAVKVTGKIVFLCRDELYDTVKPYFLRCSPGNGSPQHNLEFTEEQVTVKNARALNRPFDPSSIDDYGFTLTSFPTRLNYDDFSDVNRFKMDYVSELQDHLKHIYHASNVRVIDYLVRRRHRDFSILTADYFEEAQPGVLAHIDFSYHEAVKMIGNLYGDHAMDVMKYRRQILNVWRPLRGPVSDWPLAICDTKTFDHQRNAQLSDAAFPDWVYESILFHHHPRQDWSYFPDMEESETLLFKCVDSDASSAGRCPHAAFQARSRGEIIVPRESVESRVFLFWGPVEDFPQEVGTLYGERSKQQQPPPQSRAFNA